MKLVLRLIFGAVLAVQSSYGQSWISQASGTSASLRGVSASNARVVWASGSGGTWLRTIDGGLNWHAARVPGAEELDFRAVRGINDRTAYLIKTFAYPFDFQTEGRKVSAMVQVQF